MAVAVAIEPKLQVEPAKVELTIADTMTVSMKISMDATGTLEIPPELIFTPAVAKPVAVPVVKTESVAKPAEAPLVEAPVAVAQVEPKALEPVAAAPSPPVIESITADSATVPALAVDALLSNPDLSSATPEPSPQLDLLGEIQPSESKLAANERA